VTAVERVPIGGDLFALIDAADLPLVAPYAWSPLHSSDLVYARAWVDGNTHRRMMHNLITGWDMCDHVNGNGLDNRRINLRTASRSQNMANRRKGAGGSSRFKGVYRYRDCARWKVQIGIGGQRFYLGLFADEEAAARAYDDRAREAFGEYAALNFPKDGELSCHR